MLRRDREYFALFYPYSVSETVRRRLYVPFSVPISKEGCLSVEKASAVISWLIDLIKIGLVPQKERNLSQNAYSNAEHYHLVFGRVSIKSIFPPLAATTTAVDEAGTTHICSQTSVESETTRCGPLGFLVS